MDYSENNAAKYKRAKERIKEIKGFYMNVLAYCLVIPILGYLNYTTTSFPWVIFPMLGWGFGLLAHSLSAFNYSPIFNKKWEERKLNELMNDVDF